MTPQDKQHIETLGRLYGTRFILTVDELARTIDPWLAMEYCDNAFSTQLVNKDGSLSGDIITYISPTRFKGDQYYWTALHELGHVACGHTALDKRTITFGDVVEKEQEAWQWAIDHANRPMDAVAKAHMDEALDGYRAHAAGREGRAWQDD